MPAAFKAIAIEPTKTGVKSGAMPCIVTWCAGRVGTWAKEQTVSTTPVISVPGLGRVMDRAHYRVMAPFHIAELCGCRLD